jgi:SAM-dependent methyltransferase
MHPYFQTGIPTLTESPNRTMWWHSLPLPDGTRIHSVHADKDLQFKMWRALDIPTTGGLAGKDVLDIGAADGFFSVAARMAGARRVTSIGTADWSTWPRNIEYSDRAWQAGLAIVTADFRTYRFDRRFDVIFFLGVLYHVEDVFSCMLLRTMLVEGGALHRDADGGSVEPAARVRVCERHLSDDRTARSGFPARRGHRQLPVPE